MARGREYRFDRAFVPSLNSGPSQDLETLVHVCIYAHINSREVIKALTADGWVEVAQKGSHKQFKHPGKPGRVTVPHPRRDFPIATLRSIERQAGIALR